MSVRQGQRDAHRGLDSAQRAELSGFAIPSCAPRGVVPVVERLHHHQIGRRRLRGHVLGLRGVRGERLLAQNVLARGQRTLGPLGVEPIGQRVVDRVDLRIGDQILVASWTFGMPCSAANASARAAVPRRPRPRRPGSHRAGRTSAAGAIRAAPSVPIRRGVITRTLERRPGNVRLGRCRAGQIPPDPAL